MLPYDSANIRRINNYVYLTIKKIEEIRNENKS